MRSLFAAAALSDATAVCAQSLDDLKNDGRNTDNIRVEPEPRQQLGRAGAAHRLQRRDVRDQRAPHGPTRR